MAPQHSTIVISIDVFISELHNFERLVTSSMGEFNSYLNYTLSILGEVVHSSKSIIFSMEFIIEKLSKTNNESILLAQQAKSKVKQISFLTKMIMVSRNQIFHIFDTMSNSKSEFATFLEMFYSRSDFFCNVEGISSTQQNRASFTEYVQLLIAFLDGQLKQCAFVYEDVCIFCMNIYGVLGSIMDEFCLSAKICDSALLFLRSQVNIPNIHDANLKNINAFLIKIKMNDKERGDILARKKNETLKMYQVLKSKVLCEVDKINLLYP